MKREERAVSTQREKKSPTLRELTAIHDTLPG
eukprot:COSAG02_NODE_22766_length_741_cov_0.797508_1_plen_31_part_01